MKILHTSDWHLGVSFEGISREEDHQFFINWLIDTLKEEQIDILIIAGDVFDQPQPSAEAQKIYYQFLFQVSKQTQVKKVIVLGGNHDSPSRLDAPSELLKLLDVFIVGGLNTNTNQLSRYLCPIYNINNEVELVIAVVPYIHEYKLGVRTSFQSEKEIQSNFKQKITEFYFNLAEEAEILAKDAPIMATGHLACVGCESDDAPLEVHMVGTLGGLPNDIFDPRFSYVALGHIHRAYHVENSNAYYCGSPIPLSIKESKTARYVQIVTFQSEKNQKPFIQKIEVPILRNIIEIKGNLEEISSILKNLSWKTAKPPLLAIQISVNAYIPGIDLEIRKNLNHLFFQNTPLIAYIRQIPILNNDSKNEYTEVVSLKDLTTEQVFIKMCESQNQIVDNDLLKAFRSLLNEENI